MGYRLMRLVMLVPVAVSLMSTQISARGLPAHPEQVSVPALGVEIRLSPGWAIASLNDDAAMFDEPALHDSHNGQDYDPGRCGLQKMAEGNAKSAYDGLHLMARQHLAGFLANIRVLGKVRPFYRLVTLPTSALAGQFVVAGYFDAPGENNLGEAICQVPGMATSPELRYLLPVVMHRLTAFCGFLSWSARGVRVSPTPAPIPSDSTDDLEAIWADEETIGNALTQISEQFIPQYNNNLIDAGQLGIVLNAFYKAIGDRSATVAAIHFPVNSPHRIASLDVQTAGISAQAYIKAVLAQVNGQQPESDPAHDFQNASNFLALAERLAPLP